MEDCLGKTCLLSGCYCITWKSKSQAKLTGHFSPVIPSFADRGLSCRLHVEAPRGESGNV